MRVLDIIGRTRLVPLRRMALRVAERLGPDHTVVTIAVDSGMKYLSTELYSGA